MSQTTGTLSLKRGEQFYTLYFAGHGWMAADMVQYVEEIYQAKDQEIAILKLLGYTMEVSTTSPPRKADHWVEVDLDEKVLVSNSDLIRKAVRREPPSGEDPYLPLTLRNLYQVLDRYDFTVELIR